MRWWTLLALAGALPARAFTVASGFTEGCHERITLRAYLDFVVALPLEGVAIPAADDDEEEDETWREVAAYFAEQFPDLQTVLAEQADVTDADRFLIMSLLVGVRSPDTEGHSTLNLAQLRQLHSDPDPVGQYAHALRGPDDDGLEGAEIAAAGTRTRITELLQEAVTASFAVGANQLTLGTFYLDFYGRVELPVNAAYYALGRAAHAVQDSFAHNLRDEAGGYREILAILNYVEAIGGDHDEARDGIAHSDSMDDCMAEPGEPGGTVDAAVAATVDLFITLRALRSGLDPAAVDAFLARWFVYRPGCTVADGFCGNQRWLDVLREHQTGPYLESIFGCAASPGTPGDPGALIVLVMLPWLGSRRLVRARHAG
mgnify:FL=1